MDKSVITNLVALAVVGAGLALDGRPGALVLNTGLFALSGGLTNWLAIHMLFERVPGFYGSGVIPARFEEFKLGIKSLVMEQFFTAGNIDKFFDRSSPGADEGAVPGTRQAGVRRLVEQMDLDAAFESLVDMIMTSRFAGMLGMFGGREALLPLREPFIQRMREMLLNLSRDEAVLAQLRQISSDALLDKVERIVDQRLEELTPQLVKEIVQQMIRRHLGWLVVWGGVIGGLLGLLATLVLMPL